MDRDALLSALDRDTSRFAALLRGGDLTAPVPACPGWDLRELGVHLLQVHRWATAALTSDGPPETPEDRPDDVAAGYADGAAALLRGLRATPDDAPCWGFGEKPRTAAFWVRRQAHESAVHLWDAQVALGRAEALDPALSADGVDEVVTVMLPRQLRLGRRPPLPATLQLVATDVERSWSVGEGAPTASVSGAAGALLLLCWGRLPLTDAHLHVDGDAAAVIDGGLTP